MYYIELLVLVYRILLDLLFLLNSIERFEVIYFFINSHLVSSVPLNTETNVCNEILQVIFDLLHGYHNLEKSLLFQLHTVTRILV